MTNLYATAAIAQQRRTQFEAKAARERQIRQARLARNATTGATQTARPRRMLLLWRRADARPTAAMRSVTS